jgi:hypothetical protein
MAQMDLPYVLEGLLGAQTPEMVRVLMLFTPCWHYISQLCCTRGMIPSHMPRLECV